MYITEYTSLTVKTHDFLSPIVGVFLTAPFSMAMKYLSLNWSRPPPTS